MQFSFLFPHIEEYPINLVERGVPQDAYFECVSNSFLDGLINYTDPRKGFLVWKGSGSTSDYYDADIVEIEHLLEVYNNHPHSKFGIFGYSNAYIEVVILSETDNSYWVFWYDPDVSDCGIGRSDKSRVSWSQFVDGMTVALNAHGVVRKLDRMSGWMGWR